jgi:hypothetical protein
MADCLLMVHGCHPHLEFVADAGVSHRNGDDGRKRVLNQDAADGVERAAPLVGPLFQAIVDGADGRIGDGGVVVLERADDEERQGQDDAQDPDSAQGQQGARQLEAFFSRVDDQFTVKKEYRFSIF